MMKRSPQFLAGHLLGFYDCGDRILAWINQLDSSEMSVKEVRSALVAKILEMQPYGRGTAAQPEEDSLCSLW